MKAPPTVFILTFCRRLDLFYGTELVFKTLRRGFPNARVKVTDNASLREVRPQIAALARENDCEFRQIDGPRIEHSEFIERTIETRAAARDPGATVFLDPDVCLWESCEGFELDGLMGGLLVGAHEDPAFQSVTLPRLHTSFLWIDDASALQRRIDEIRVPHLDFRPFQPVSLKLGDAWLRYDTGAGLFAAATEDMSFFTEEHRDRYDHIFCGSHFDLWTPHYKGEMATVMRRIHDRARSGEIEGLRGCYKAIDAAWIEAFPPAGDLGEE